jgi:hypothetical protein
MLNFLQNGFADKAIKKAGQVIGKVSIYEQALKDIAADKTVHGCTHSETAQAALDLARRLT